jgi:hypothetical protein
MVPPAVVKLRDDSLPDSEITLVFVYILLTDPKDPQWKDMSRIPMCDLLTPVGFNGRFQRSVVIGVSERVDDEREMRRVDVVKKPRKREDPQADDNYQMNPIQAIHVAGRGLIDTLERYPRATIVVIGRVPKSVSMPLGWYLANAHDSDPKRGAPVPYPWRRIVPLGYFEEHPLKESGYQRSSFFPLRPMWVRNDQADPAKLLRDAGVTSWPYSSVAEDSEVDDFQPSTDLSPRKTLVRGIANHLRKGAQCLDSLSSI